MSGVPTTQPARPTLPPKVSVESSCESTVNLCPRNLAFVDYPILNFAFTANDGFRDMLRFGKNGVNGGKVPQIAVRQSTQTGRLGGKSMFHKAAICSCEQLGSSLNQGPVSFPISIYFATRVPDTELSPNGIKF